MELIKLEDIPLTPLHLMRMWADLVYYEVSSRRLETLKLGWILMTDSLYHQMNCHSMFLWPN